MLATDIKGERIYWFPNVMAPYGLSVRKNTFF